MIGNFWGGLVHQIFARAKRHFILVYMLYTYTHIYLYITKQGVYSMKNNIKDTSLRILQFALIGFLLGITGYNITTLVFWLVIIITVICEFRRE